MCYYFKLEVYYIFLSTKTKTGQPQAQKTKQRKVHTDGNIN